MAKIYKIKEKHKPGVKGRRRVVAFRLMIAVKGARPFALELRATKYTENDALQLAGILGEIENAYNEGARLNEKALEFLDYFPDAKERLGKHGFIKLVKERTLFDLWEEYERANINNWKPATIGNKQRARARFFTFFLEGQTVESIGKQEARAFRGWLDAAIEAGTIAEATAAACMRDVKAVFNWAALNEWIKKTPFDGVKKGSFVNTDRQKYIELVDFARLLDACPSKEWRVLLLLARLQGFRIPSESSGLKWVDVDFSRKEMIIHSPKTEGHKDKGIRKTPIFPDVFKALQELKDEQQANGARSPYVLPNIRERNNVRTGLEKIIYIAGLDKWPKLFQNMRSSAATDIKRRYGEKAESLWVGHSPEIAFTYYEQIPPATLEAAKQWDVLNASF